MSTTTHKYEMQKPYSVKHKVEYDALRNAVDRCYRESHPQYHDYGGRGVTVDAFWRNGMPGFIDFFQEIGPRPNATMTLDRIDNNKGYEPGNVRWATRYEQNMNRRNTHTPEQIEMFKQAAAVTGASYSTIRARYNRGIDIFSPFYPRLLTKEGNAKHALTPARVPLELVEANLAKLPKARIPARRLRNDKMRAEFRSGEKTVMMLQDEYKLVKSMVIKIVWGRA